jgi:flagellar hook-associated protein 1 FlgK
MLSYTTGLSALSNAQTAIRVTSDNIANTSTQGYKRNTIVQEQANTISTTYGNLGTGADVTAIARVTNEFIEAQYLDASSDEQKWEICQDKLTTIEALLSQDEEFGLEAVLENFWNSWQDLANDPDSEAAKVVVQSSGQAVVDAIDDLYDGLKDLQAATDSEINDVVAQVNGLSEQIAKLNLDIVTDPDNNDLLNERDLAIRDLAELADISTVSGSDGQITIMIGQGHSLVQGGNTHELSLEAARSETSLVPDSSYEGEVQFSGDSSEEYLLEFVSDGADGTALFKVSTDNGSSWMSDENGDPMLFSASGTADNPTTVGDIEIWFQDGGTSLHSAGDQYTIVPKTGLYWEGSSGDVNITPLTTDQGEDVAGRVSGGTLGGLFQTRDSYMGDYLDQLDTLASSLIYEVNAVYSQGAGLEGYSTVQGVYAANDTAAIMADSGLAYAENLSAGEFTLVSMDAAGESSTAR